MLLLLLWGKCLYDIGFYLIKLTTVCNNFEKYVFFSKLLHLVAAASSCTSDIFDEVYTDGFSAVCRMIFSPLHDRMQGKSSNLIWLLL